MSFLVVFNGQFAPISYPVAHTRNVHPVSPAEHIQGVQEFRQELEAAHGEEHHSSNTIKIAAYTKSKELFEQKRKRQYAKDIMSISVKTIQPQVAAEEARVLLNKHSIRHLPVVNAQNMIQGMVSDRELSGPLKDKKCSDIMLSKVIVCEENASINEVAIILLKEKINAMPVVNHKHELTGIITLSDILTYVIQSTSFLGNA
jgi:CBS-domain-containing membrane protein